MYPVAPILVVAILNKDKKVYRYIIPLAVFGLIVAFYNVLIQESIIPEDLTNCTLGIPCKTEYFRILRFVTIPFMSFLSFIAVLGSMYILSLNKGDKSKS
jgi:disulfide bond formation protein DsbB